MPPGLSSAMTIKRIHREIADLKKEDLGPIVLEPSDNLHIWKGSIPGPQGSLYEGGIFNLEISLPADYPFSAPKVMFKTRIYHMNISEQGNICIDILKQNWSPALSLFKVMLSLSSLLTDPNPKDPLVPSIATQYIRSRKQHDATARQWTDMYARPKPPPPPPPPVVTQPPPSPKSSRSKGKKRAKAGPSTANAAGSSSSASRATRSTATTASASANAGIGATSSSTPDEVIVLDSDEEDSGCAAPAAGSSSKGKKRKRGVADPEEVVDLLDSDKEEEEVAAKRIRTLKPPSRAGASAGASGGRRSLIQMGDVIVIDD